MNITALSNACIWTEEIGGAPHYLLEDEEGIGILGICRISEHELIDVKHRSEPVQLTPGPGEKDAAFVVIGLTRDSRFAGVAFQPATNKYLGLLKPMPLAEVERLATSPDVGRFAHPYVRLMRSYYDALFTTSRSCDAEVAATPCVIPDDMHPLRSLVIGRPLA